jgi:hypothetical protein
MLINPDLSVSIGSFIVYASLRMPRHPTHTRALHSRADVSRIERTTSQYGNPYPRSIRKLCDPTRSR